MRSRASARQRRSRTRRSQRSRRCSSEGVIESEFALALDVAMRRLGAEDRAFETIVASGPNSAKPMRARATVR